LLKDAYVATLSKSCGEKKHGYLTEDDNASTGLYQFNPNIFVGC
jgi:hypothetical protein